jgi:hypothetical protein
VVMGSPPYGAVLKDRATIRLARSIDGKLLLSTVVALQTLLHAGKKAVEVKAARVSSILFDATGHIHIVHTASLIVASQR